MKRILLSLIVLAFSVTLASAQSSQRNPCYYLSPSSTSCQPVSSTTPLPVTAAIVPGGTQDVNISQILGAAPSLTNPLWVSPATGATFPVSGSVTSTGVGFSFTNVATNADTVVKDTPGTFGGLIINTAGLTSSVTVYNNTTCTGAKIGTFSSLAQVSLQINAIATVGICMTTAGGTPADVTILWR